MEKFRLGSRSCLRSYSVLLHIIIYMPVPFSCKPYLVLDSRFDFDELFDFGRHFADSTAFFSFKHSYKVVKIKMFRKLLYVIHYVNVMLLQNV